MVLKTCMCGLFHNIFFKTRIGKRAAAVISAAALMAACTGRPAAAAPAAADGQEEGGWSQALTVTVLSAMHMLARTDALPEAETVKLKLTGDDGRESYGSCIDHWERSYCSFQTDTVLHVTAASELCGVYLEFETPCRWTLTLPDGTVRQGGENAFMHEYMALEQPAASFELALPKGAQLTEIYGFTDGRLPEWVQVWQPPCDKADLLVLPTHADDEFLWFGGALPYYAGELGYRVQVVYMTNHFQETKRCHELLNGLWTAGVTYYPVISERFADSYDIHDSLSAAERTYGHANVVAFQVEMLRRFAPRVVLGHDVNGEYGHGAHMLNAQTLLEALELIDDPEAYPESAGRYGLCRVQKCYLHSWQERPIVVEWREIKLRRFQGKSAFKVAEECFACHLSQLNYFRVIDWGPHSCNDFGLAYTTVGDDSAGTNDLFEHIDWSPYAGTELERLMQPVLADDNG